MIKRLCSSAFGVWRTVGLKPTSLSNTYVTVTILPSGESNVIRAAENILFFTHYHYQELQQLGHETTQIADLLSRNNLKSSDPESKYYNLAQ